MQHIKILISGAGIAGLTCAGLLAKQGVEYTIIERDKESEFNKSGYMLGLLPLGGRVLNQLNLREDYLKSSTKMTQYEIFNGSGKLAKSFPLDYINENYGHYGGISRAKLIELLLKKMQGKILFNNEIEYLKQKENEVEAKLTNEKAETYDLVIISEGLHSKTRKILLHENEFSYYETNWGGWVSWLSEGPGTNYKEFWGNGRFLGLYPVENKVGAFLGGPTNYIKTKGKNLFIDEFASELTAKQTLAHRALGTLKNEDDPFFWNFHDCRATKWYKGNTVLLGDAATGFLPTAGVGASMAMDSASALVDELSRADKDHLTYALKLYSKRQKQRAELAQKDSRQLGKFMFINNSLKTKIRNRILSFYSLRRMLSDLSKILEGE